MKEYTGGAVGEKTDRRKRFLGRAKNANCRTVARQNFKAMNCNVALVKGNTDNDDHNSTDRVRVLNNNNNVSKTIQ